MNADSVGTDAADDLLSEVFVAAFRSRKSYDSQFSNAVPWLLGIAANMVRHHRRAEGRRSAFLKRLVQEPHQQPDPFLDEVSSETIGRCDSEEIGIALAQLDGRYRDVVILHAAFDLSYTEIAKSLGLRLGTVRSRLSRGRRQLRELLSDSGQYVADGEHQRALRAEVEGTS